MKTKFLALSFALFTNIALAHSYPPTLINTGQQSGDNGFTYPDVTHLESEAWVDDVVFFYPSEMIDFFEGDIEALVDWVEQSVDVNNIAFQRQDIPIRRKIAGIVAIPSALSFNVESDRVQRINSLRRLYANNEYNYDFFYDVSYVVAVTPHLPDFVNAIGAAEVGGKFSWVSPFNLSRPERTLAHELGHNDGLTHDKEEYDALSDRRGRFGPYAVGDECGTFDSIMKSGTGNRNEGFFSSPLVTNAQNQECGIENESDSARAYMEAASDHIPNRHGTFLNNKPSREATGTVSLSLQSTNINEGEPIEVEVLWSGAELGDSVQVIARQGSAGLNDFRSSLRSLYFDGESSTSRVAIETFNDDDFEIDETVIIQLVFPHGVSLSGQASQEVGLTSDDLGNAGLINFTTSALSINEGQSATLTLERTGGSDGSFSVNITTEAGSADGNDFTETNKTIVFASGETTKTVSISTRNDSTQENAEIFTVRLSGDQLVIGSTDEVTVTIAASDAPTSGGSGSSGDGGGSMGFFSGFLMLLLLLRRFKNQG